MCYCSHTPLRLSLSALHYNMTLTIRGMTTTLTMALSTTSPRGVHRACWVLGDQGIVNPSRFRQKNPCIRLDSTRLDSDLVTLLLCLAFAASPPDRIYSNTCLEYLLPSCLVLSSELAASFVELEIPWSNLRPFYVLCPSAGRSD